MAISTEKCSVYRTIVLSNRQSVHFDYWVFARPVGEKTRSVGEMLSFMKEADRYYRLIPDLPAIFEYR